MDIAELIYAEWQAEEELMRQRNVVLARDYFEGDHDVPLTERQKEFLGFNADDERFAINYCRTVIAAVVDRLLVQAFDSTSEELAGWAWEAWQANRMDALQREVHEMAVRDGEAFVMVDWDGDEMAVRFVPHPRYTSPEEGGTGFGMKAFYANGEGRGRMTHASKRWTETEMGENGKRVTRQRLTEYWPNEVRRYRMESVGREVKWQEIKRIPWVDANGQPLGIPVVHFRNPGGRSDLWDAIPIQDAINKAALDLLATADANGYRILFTRGFYPTTDGLAPESDGGNYLEIYPGCILGHPDPQAALDSLPGADLGPMIELMDSLILKLAQVTDTPTSRFQLTRQVAAEGTLKQQEEPLLAKVRTRQTIFGNGWENAMYAGRRLAVHFGPAAVAEGRVEAQWAEAGTRDEKAHLEMLKLKAELGVPAEQLWAEMGYDQEQIAEMRAMAGAELERTSNVGGELLRAFEQGGVAR